MDNTYRREQYFHRKFKFIEPEKTFIGPEEKSFYYLFPVNSTLSRLLDDDSVRSQIINRPLFTLEKVF